MDKPNVFKSSNFHMDSGDVLHMLFLDETGVTMDVDLWSAETTAETVPDAPTALDASDITDSSFTANWYFNENTTGYYLDVAHDSAFTSMVAGYNNLDVGHVNNYGIVGLVVGQTCYYRLRAYNDIGTSVSSDVVDVITNSILLTDGDGNAYTTVIINGQEWLVENFKVTKYADGTLIPNLTDNASWVLEDGSLGHNGAYRWYNDDILNKNPYGALYGWYAVNNTHGFAYLTKSGSIQEGWRIPTSNDFFALQAFLGGEAVAGAHLKEIGTAHWLAPNLGADNSSGFTGLPGGQVDSGTIGECLYLRRYSFYIASDGLVGDVTVLTFDFDLTDGYVYTLPSPTSKNYAWSVRLVKDL